MSTEPPNPGQDSPGLAALATVTFDQLDAEGILATASAAVASVAPCRVEASYLRVDGEMVQCPSSQGRRPDIDRLLRESGVDGPVQMPGKQWGWAFALRHQDVVNGCVVVSAAAQPEPNAMLLLTVLALQTGAALGFAARHEHDGDRTAQLTAAVDRLQTRITAYQILGAAVAGDSGDQGIADALHELTALPVAVEDRFGNLRSWAGPGRPERYPKPDPRDRETLLHRLGAHGGAARVRDRMAILVKPRTDILGVLALIVADERPSDDQMFALQYASTVLGFELSHQRNLAEMELSLCRELVDDLVAGTNQEGAYARAEAIGHDLRQPHYVVVVHCDGGADSPVATAAGRAATALHFEYLLGRHAGLVVLMTAGRPDPTALHHELSRQLGTPTCAIGIGSRCDSPGDFPESFDKARRALSVRLHSAVPAGASAYDELGFYHLVNAADAAAADDFVREWLGVLIDYDANKHSTLVQTLSAYLECGGSYDDSAAALNIHRSTLRYRLTRISDLTGHDLRNVDTRFNLHAATRAWRFLNPRR